MIPLIKQAYTSSQFKSLMASQWYMNFVLTDSTTERKYAKVVLPEFTDLGWVYMSVANIFEDKLSSAERIVLGYLLSQNQATVLQLNLEDRDRRQLLNAFLALKQYKETGQSNILLPLDMATSALILMSAMYRCPTTMAMVGLSSKATTIEERILEPVSDSYTKLHIAALNKLPPSQRKSIASVLTRNELKKLVIMPDYYGSTSAIERIPEELREPYLQAKRELVPAQMKHLSWGALAGQTLVERGVTHPQWTCAYTGRNVGYMCTETIGATVHLPDAQFDVAKVVEGNPYHLRIIANTVHSPDSSLLIPIYQKAAELGITMFTTHDAINVTASNLNYIRQLTIEGIIDIAITNPLVSMSEQLNLPMPDVEDINPWLLNLCPHNFMS